MCNSRYMLVNFQFFKYHIWKREEMTNTSIGNIFGIWESFHTETKEIRSLYLSEVLQSTELG